MKVRGYCPRCVRAADIGAPAEASGACARCGEPWTYRARDAMDSAVTRCGFCGNRAFFVQRDFDQRIGCAIMVASIAAALCVGARFGWIWFTPVLLATVLIDWVLAVAIRPVTICYRCDAEYRGQPLNPRHHPYDPHVAERYAAKKTVRRMVD